MYYDRTLSPDFSKLVENGGALRWLFDYVKNNAELDFLIGRNKGTQWISVYRGLTRILKITPCRDINFVNAEAAEAYQKIAKIKGYRLYGKTIPVSQIKESEFKQIAIIIKNDKKFDRYFNNKKEGYYQNMLSRKYGVCGKANDDFVIIDKEAVIGYLDQPEKNHIFGSLQKNYKELQNEISKINSKRYGKNIEKKTIGNELDFLGLDKEGYILLIEYKHGSGNTSGIYLSPLQIGLYYDLFSYIPKNELKESVFKMLQQKQKIGLINPKWAKPTCINGIIPILIISEYNYKGSAKIKYAEIISIVRKKMGVDFLNNIKTYNYTAKNGLNKW